MCKWESPAVTKERAEDGVDVVRSRGKVTKGLFLVQREHMVNLPKHTAVLLLEWQGLGV